MTTQDSERRSKDSFAQAFLKSGSSLQYRVASILKKNGWEVKLEQAYMDDTESKVRQCDIIATRLIHGGDVKVELIIECKYVKDGHIVFLRDDAEDYSSKKDERSESIQAVSSYFKEHFDKRARDSHHYFGPICLSYACLVRDKDGRFKVDDDTVFKAIGQVIKPMIDRAKGTYENTVTYPIIVIGNSEIYECAIGALPDLASSSEEIPFQFESKENICLEYSYVLGLGQKTSTFVIDILKGDSFEEYLLQVIEPEIGQLIECRNGITTARDMRRMRGDKTNGSLSYR